MSIIFWLIGAFPSCPATRLSVTGGSVFAGGEDVGKADGGRLEKAYAIRAIRVYLVVETATSIMRFTRPSDALAG